LFSAQELRDAFLAIDTGDGQLDALELQEAARKVAPRHVSASALSAWGGYSIPKKRERKVGDLE